MHNRPRPPPVPYSEEKGVESNFHFDMLLV